MDAKELDRVISGVAIQLPEKLLENKGFEEVIRAICLISSYLKSEQDHRYRDNERREQHIQLMNKQLIEFDKVIWGDKQNLEESPGIAYEFAMNRKQRKRNEKLITAVLVAVIAQFFVLLKIFLK